MIGSAFRTVYVRVLVTFTTLLLIGLVGAYVQVTSTERRIVDQVVSEQTSLTQQLIKVFARQVSTRMQHLEQTTFLLSDLSIVQFFLLEEDSEDVESLGNLVLDVFQNVLISNSYVMSLRLVSLDGYTRIKITPLETEKYDVSTKRDNIRIYNYFPYIKQISMNEVGVFIGDSYEHEEPHIEVVAPVYDGFLPLGYVVQTVSVGALVAEMLEFTGKSDAFLLLLSEDGHYLFGEHGELTFDQQPFTTLYPNAWKHISQRTTKAAVSTPQIIHDQGVRFVVRPLDVEFDNLGVYRSWLVAYFTDDKVAALSASEQAHLSTRMTMFMLVVVVIALLIAWWTYRRSLMLDLSFMAQAAMRSMSPIVLMDRQQHMLNANAAFLRLMGMTSESSKGQRLSSLLNERDRVALEKIWQGLTKEPSWKGELKFTNCQGTPVEGLFQIFPLESRRKKIIGYVGSWVDISEQKELERRLRNLTITDALTGCKNRRYFDKELQMLFSNLKRHSDQQFCLAIADIDHFKQVNDAHGHDVGDEVLQIFSSVLVRETRDLDIVCRVGGEEFAILLPNTSLNDAVLVMERVRKTVATVSHAGHFITCSIGLADSNDAADEESLYKQADQALYLAKENGRNQVILHH